MIGKIWDEVMIEWCLEMRGLRVPRRARRGEVLLILGSNAVALGVAVFFVSSFFQEVLELVPKIVMGR